MAVNLVTVGTINRVRLYQGQPGTSFATVYTAPASPATDVKVTSIVVCNTTAIAATITIAVVASGGTAGVTNEIATAVPVAANSITPIEVPIYMTAGDFISMLQGTASALTVTISGETYA